MDKQHRLLRDEPVRGRVDYFVIKSNALLLVIGALALLEVACRYGLIDRHSVIPPTAMFQGAWNAVGSEETRADILLTLQNVALSLVLSLIVGTAAGLLLHKATRLRRALDPLLASYYAVPTFVFYPLFIVLFGLNRWPLIAIGFLFAVVAVASSIRSTDSRAFHARSCAPQP